MKNKILFLFVALALVLSVSMVSAAVTVVSPGASAKLSGDVILNASGVELMNCTFYVKSASTNATAWALIAGPVANSGTNLSVNATFSSLVLEDSNDYIFNATCRNSTNGIHDGTRSGITIDNTVPSAPTVLTPTTNTVLALASTQSFSSTVVGANTTGCTYYLSISGNVESGSATNTGDTCTFTKAFTSNINGDYTWYLTATDGTNTSSASTTNNLVVNIPGGGVGKLPAGTTPQKDNKTMMIVIVLGALVAIYLMGRKN